MRLYVNAVQVTSDSGLSRPLPDSTADLIIGSQGDASNHFDGIIDDVWLHDFALTAQEVSDLYNAALDATPPTSPQELMASSIGTTTVDLKWLASSDPETKIDHYEIRRDRNLVGESASTAFTDTGLAHSTSYTYEVVAVNGQGLTSPPSAPLEVTTLAPGPAPSVGAHWKFDETSGVTASDSGGGGHDGSLQGGPIWTTGIVEGGLRFDGQDDRVVVPAVPLAMNT